MENKLEFSVVVVLIFFITKLIVMFIKKIFLVYLIIVNHNVMFTKHQKFEPHREVQIINGLYLRE